MNTYYISDARFIVEEAKKILQAKSLSHSVLVIPNTKGMSFETIKELKSINSTIKIRVEGEYTKKHLEELQKNSYDFIAEHSNKEHIYSLSDMEQIILIIEKIEEHMQNSWTDDQKIYYITNQLHHILNYKLKSQDNDPNIYDGLKGLISGKCQSMGYAVIFKELCDRNLKSLKCHVVSGYLDSDKPSDISFWNVIEGKHYNEFFNLAEEEQVAYSPIRQPQYKMLNIPSYQQYSKKNLYKKPNSTFKMNEKLFNYYFINDSFIVQIGNQKYTGYPLGFTPVNASHNRNLYYYYLTIEEANKKYSPKIVALEYNIIDCIKRKNQAEIERIGKLISLSNINDSINKKSYYLGNIKNNIIIKEQTLFAQCSYEKTPIKTLKVGDNYLTIIFEKNIGDKNHYRIFSSENKNFPRPFLDVYKIYTKRDLFRINDSELEIILQEPCLQLAADVVKGDLDNATNYEYNKEYTLTNVPNLILYAKIHHNKSPNQPTTFVIPNTKGLTIEDIEEIEKINPRFTIRVSGEFTSKNISQRRVNANTTNWQSINANTYTLTEMKQILFMLELIEFGINPNWTDDQKLIFIIHQLKRMVYYTPILSSDDLDPNRKISDGLRGLITGYCMCLGQAIILKELCDRNLTKYTCHVVGGSVQNGKHAWNIISYQENGVAKNIAVDIVAEQGLHFTGDNANSTNGIGLNDPDYKYNDVPYFEELQKNIQKIDHEKLRKYKKKYIFRELDASCFYFEHNGRKISGFPVYSMQLSSEANEKLYYYNITIEENGRTKNIICSLRENLSILFFLSMMDKKVQIQSQSKINDICDKIFSSQNIQDSKDKKTLYLGRIVGNSVDKSDNNILESNENKIKEISSEGNTRIVRLRYYSSNSNRYGYEILVPGQINEPKLRIDKSCVIHYRIETTLDLMNYSSDDALNYLKLEYLDDAAKNDGDLDAVLRKKGIRK